MTLFIFSLPTILIGFVLLSKQDPHVYATLVLSDIFPFPHQPPNKIKTSDYFRPEDQMKIKAIRVFGDNFLHAIAARFRSGRREKSRSAIQK